jgi:hypothetical protein
MTPCMHQRPIAGNVSLSAMCKNIQHGWLEWTHARHIVRVQRIAENPATGKSPPANATSSAARRPKRSSHVWP